MKRGEAPSEEKADRPRSIEHDLLKADTRSRMVAVLFYLRFSVYHYSQNYSVTDVQQYIPIIVASIPDTHNAL